MNAESALALVEFIKANPDLPIFPVVARDDFAYKSNLDPVAEFTWVSVEKYIIGNEEIFFKSYNDDGLLSVWEMLEGILTEEEFIALPDDDDDCKQYYDNLPWKEAIFIGVEPSIEEDFE